MYNGIVMTANGVYEFINKTTVSRDASTLKIMTGEEIILYK